MDNNLTTIDVSGKAFLEEFSCARNSITDINVVYCPSLKSLDCNDNEIKSIDLSGCSNLLYVKCRDNHLENIKLQDCLLIQELYCNNNFLDSLKLPESHNLTELNCRNNRLDFFTLPKVSFETTNYIYAQQTDREIEANINYADFSDFYEIDGIVSTYLWHEVVQYLKPEMIEDGVFYFGESFLNKRLICRISNKSFPGLVIRYDVTMTNNDVGNVSPEKNAPSVYASEGFIHIVTGSAVDVRVYSMQGALLLTKNVAEGRADIPFERGTYMVAVNNSEGRVMIVR